MISHEEVVMAFRYCLGRSPNANEDLEGLKAMGDYRVLREFLMSQPEFVSRIQPLLRADRSTNPLHAFERQAIVFIHIQKTAGTTVTDALENQIEAARCCPERFNHLHLYAPSELAKYDAYFGHFDLFSTRYIPRRKKFVFCIFRDPAERLISYYRFMRAHPKGPALLSDPLFALADSLSIEDYYAHPAIRNSRTVNNHYRAVLSGSLDPTISDDTRYCGTLKDSIDALRNLDGIGLTGRLSESLSLIFGAAGLKAPAEGARLMNSDNMHLIDEEVKPVPKITMTERLFQVMADLINDDVIIFRDAETLFSERTRGLA